MRATNEEWFTRAERLFPGGVNSPARAYAAVGGTPPVFVRGEGAYMYDVEGKRYIDYLAAYGPLILGHAQIVSEPNSCRAEPCGLRLFCMDSWFFFFTASASVPVWVFLPTWLTSRHSVYRFSRPILHRRRSPFPRRTDKCPGHFLLRRGGARRPASPFRRPFVLRRRGGSLPTRDEEIRPMPGENFRKLRIERGHRRTM